MCRKVPIGKLVNTIGIATFKNYLQGTASQFIEIIIKARLISTILKTDCFK